MKLGRRRKRSQLIWYVFLLPVLLGVVLFMLYPVAESIRLSFYKSNGSIETFVGLKNYITIVNTPVFAKAIYNTFYLAFFQLLIIIPFSFILASMINELRFGKNLFKVVYYLPNITSATAAGMVFLYVLHPNEGLLNTALSAVGLPTSVWLAAPTSARWGAIILGIWRGLGFNIIICLANLQAIPNEYYEAAHIDGANRLQSWWHITVPGMKSTFAFFVITGWIGGLQRFTDVFMLGGTEGSPDRSLHTLVSFIFERGFGGFEFGIAAAASFILFFIILIITVFNTKMTKMD